MAHALQGEALAGTVHAVCVGLARPLRVDGGRTLASAIGKRAVAGPVPVYPLGLAGDEQADWHVHGGLQKAVYAYPAEHMAFWQAQRRQHGVPVAGAQDGAGEGGGAGDALPPGFLGENLRISGLLETQAWVGDTLHFSDSGCVLRITAPREPCGKFAAVMGFAEAARVMVREARCGFYLAVEKPGTLAAGMRFVLRPGSRGLSVAEAIRAKWARHRL